MISFIVPTVGRPSLYATLRSIETLPGDEIIIVGKGVTHGLRSLADNYQQIKLVDCEPGGDWGHTERNFATPFATGSYVAHIDDDDTYAPGARALMADAIAEAVNKPILFRMRYPNGITLWEDKVVRCGNVGTPMFLIPNQPDKLGTWESFVGGDCRFLETSRWSLTEDYIWRPEVIALLGHN